MQQEHFVHSGGCFSFFSVQRQPKPRYLLFFSCKYSLVAAAWIIIRRYEVPGPREVRRTMAGGLEAARRVVFQCRSCAAKVAKAAGVSRRARARKRGEKPKAAESPSLCNVRGSSRRLRIIKIFLVVSF